MLENMARPLEDQCESLSKSIGQGLPRAVVQGALETLAAAPPHKDFIRYKDTNFIYTKLDESANDVVRCLVDEWINVCIGPMVLGLWLTASQKPDNIARAAAAAGRAPSRENIVKAFCGFRFKELRKKTQPVEGLAVVKRERSTVVILAVESLDLSNGCFVKLEMGQDVCVDGNMTILMPGTSDGLGILIDLNL